MLGGAPEKMRQLAANTYSTAKMKPGAGSISPEMDLLAQKLQGVQGVGVVTAANDSHHKGFKSAHNEDRALDFRITDIAKASEVIAQMRKQLDDAGYKGKYTILDETKKSGPNWTGPHVHVQINNNTGGNNTVQVSQMPKAGGS